MAIYFRILLLLAVFAHGVKTNDDTYNVTVEALDYWQYLESPGYPTGYENNMTYYFHITTNNDSLIVTMEMEDCWIEYADLKVDKCQLDRLTIYDGENETANILYDGCCLHNFGQLDAPAILNSTGPSMLFKLWTDPTIVEKGFRIKYYHHLCCRVTTTTEPITTVSTAAPEEEGLNIIMLGAVGAGCLAAFIIIVMIINKIKCGCCEKQQPIERKKRVGPRENEDDMVVEDEDMMDEPKINGFLKPPLTLQNGIIVKPLDEKPNSSAPGRNPPGTHAHHLPPLPKAIAPGRPDPPPRDWTQVGGMKNPDLDGSNNGIFANEGKELPEQNNTNKSVFGTHGSSKSPGIENDGKGSSDSGDGRKTSSSHNTDKTGDGRKTPGPNSSDSGFFGSDGRKTPGSNNQDSGSNGTDGSKTPGRNSSDKGSFAMDGRKTPGFNNTGRGIFPTDGRKTPGRNSSDKELFGIGNGANTSGLGNFDQEILGSVGGMKIPGNGMNDNGFFGQSAGNAFGEKRIYGTGVIPTEELRPGGTRALPPLPLRRGPPRKPKSRADAILFLEDSSGDDNDGITTPIGFDF